MQTGQFNQNVRPELVGWVGLGRASFFLISRKRLLTLSLFLFLLTALFTWLGYHYTISFIDSLTRAFFDHGQTEASITGWLKNAGFAIMHFFYLIITRVVGFYLAFMIAYTLTSPGYGVLSAVAEKLWAGEWYEDDDGLTIHGLLIDFWEAIKIALFGIVVTISALLVNFIPLLGQAIAFLLYTYYSALMFLDYPTSRRRWSLGKKIGWMTANNISSLHLGILPALVSMIPIVNIFVIAFLFPILTIYATLNFTNIELNKRLQSKQPQGTKHGH